MKQHYGTIAVGGLNPNEVSDVVLTSGSYSLSTLSTIPYIQLLGPSGAQKLFSWNERIDIPDGETARIQNASCHKGDVFINGGSDYTTLPGRVTVPVPIVRYVGGGGDIIFIPEYPVDTRRARRAFFVFYSPLDTDDPPVPDAIAVIKGSVINHTHDTGNLIALAAFTPPLNNSGIGYVAVQTLPGLTITPMIPLGYGASFTDSTNPHALLDCAIPYIYADEESAWDSFPLTAYYVLEY
jgi:hypothetical protein